MKTLFELLADKPEAVQFLEQRRQDTSIDSRIAENLWIVGGAARWMLSEGRLPFPKDIDILHDVTSLGNLHADGLVSCDEYEGGQKITVPIAQGVVNFDVFRNRLTQWLRGAPCVGDQLAVRLHDNFVLCVPAACGLSPEGRNPNWSGDNPAYFDAHAVHVARDGAVLYRHFGLAHE